MNSILNRGFVHPYIVFQFDAGTIDTEPPRYFASFTQTRTAEKACTFTLNITYTPSVDDGDVLRIHQLLLSSVNKPVYYQYGYVTPGGGLVVQNKLYTGLFTNYDEQMDQGFLNYTISGVSRAIEVNSPTVNIQQFLADLKSKGGMIQPSEVARKLIFEDETTGIKELFQDFEIHIDQVDEPVDVSEINFYGNTLHDVFFGTVIGEHKQPGGLVSLSRMEYSPDEIVEHGIFSDTEINLYNNFKFKAAHGISSQISQEEQNAFDAVNMLSTCPFVCYFDNVVNTNGEHLKGSFHYVPKYTRQVTDIFTYHYGNSFIDSDVLSFNAKIDGGTAMASVLGLDEIDSNIDANGNIMGSNLNAVGYLEGFKPCTYSTVSGFNDAAMVTATTLAHNLNFPFEAEMTVVGQTDCNELLDLIHVDVYVNGVKHDLFSGNYVINEITDNLSAEGFTTTFKMIKSISGIYDSSDAPNYISTKNDLTSRPYTDQRAFRNDYGK